MGKLGSWAYPNSTILPAKRERLHFTPNNHIQTQYYNQLKHIVDVSIKYNI